MRLKKGYNPCPWLLGLSNKLFKILRLILVDRTMARIWFALEFVLNKRLSTIKIHQLNLIEGHMQIAWYNN